MTSDEYDDLAKQAWRDYCRERQRETGSLPRTLNDSVVFRAGYLAGIEKGWQRAQAVHDAR